MDQDSHVVVRNLGHVDYETAWHAMQAFCARRHELTADEIWLLQHPPVYTSGLRGRRREYANPHNIPFVHSDRGGDMTYHGPGQVLAYVLMDLVRRGWGVKQLVHGLEQAVIDLLEAHGIQAQRRAGAPGVYVMNKKIAALGLRVRRGMSYHGLALNVDMDLTPFDAIDPCGYSDLEVTQLADLEIRGGVARAGEMLIPYLTRNLGYKSFEPEADPLFAHTPSSSDG